MEPTPAQSPSARSNRHKNNPTSMRRSQRPQSRDSDITRSRPLEPLTKKVFNCIVDDSALLAGAKKSTRDGMRKWITNGQIRLFVPLYTLGQTSRLKDTSGRISTDAEEALLWLDDATSTMPHLVTLQGGFEKFETWAEVEKLTLPRPLFSEGDLEDDTDMTEHLSYEADSKLTLEEKREKNLSMSSVGSDASRSASPSSDRSVHSPSSPLSPPDSPAKTSAEPCSRRGVRPTSLPSIDNSTADASGSGVPHHLRPLFNYILWRIHQEIDPGAALDSFIFLCDDPAKSRLAGRFGIRVKTLADIRFVVAREEREFKNRQLVQRKENEKAGGSAPNSRPPTRGSVAALAPALEIHAVTNALASVSAGQEDDDDDDEEEILHKRAPKAPAAMIAAQQQRSPRPANKVLDPNNFSRNGVHAAGRGNIRGGASRGGAARGVASSGRGSGGRPRDMSGSPNQGPIESLNARGGPIDPNSFSRPSTNRFRGGGGRRLWQPT